MKQSETIPDFISLSKAFKAFGLLPQLLAGRSL
jgi:hypothetical protein